MKKYLRRKYRRKRKSYSISQLLNRQPKSLLKHEKYNTMISLYKKTVKLQNLKLAPKCFRILNKAAVSPEKIDAFYKYFDLPDSPFFKLFIIIKKDHINKQNNLRQKREKQISKDWDKLPKQVLLMFTEIHTQESNWNSNSESPWFYKEIWPHTLKKIEKYSSMSKTEWIEFFIDISNRLSSYYSKSSNIIGNLIPLFILNLLSENSTSPTIEQTKKAYRYLSKKHHPDRGGDVSDFRKLKWARDQLLDSI